MPLAYAPLQPVQPGSPVTADGWNAILGRVLSTLPVRVTASGAPVLDARVVAVADAVGQGAVAIEAVPPYPGVDSYTVVGVTPGQWQVLAFTELVHAAPVAVTLQDGPQPFVADVVEVELAGRSMPDLTGMSVPRAVETLASVGVTLEAASDSIHDVATGLSLQLDFFLNDPAYVGAARIAWHEPAPGTLFDPGNRRLWLFVGASLGWTSVPQLDGLAYDAAVAALAAASLFPSPESVTAHEANPDLVVKGANPASGTPNRPLGAYVDLVLERP